MYPIVRIIKEALRARRMPPLKSLDTHVSYHRCWPQDLDIFMEMNNGRILTVLEIGRIGLAQRVGLLDAIKDNGWGLVVAGTSVRYRKRIKPFVKFRIVSRAYGWDDKFFYLENSAWIGDECAVQGLFRTAITDNNGIVPIAKVFAATGRDGTLRDMPDWVNGWIDADATRPWPPENDGTS
jgi:acyl-CoA thioesterase FadM